MLGGLIFELRHAGSLSKHGKAVEHPSQLGVRRHMALDKQDALFRIKATGDILRKHLQRLAPQRCRILTHRDRMHVNHAVDAVIILLQQRKVADRAQVIAQRQFAGRLDTRKNGLLLIFAHIENFPYKLEFTL